MKQFQSSYHKRDSSDHSIKRCNKAKKRHQIWRIKLIELERRHLEINEKKIQDIKWAPPDLSFYAAGQEHEEITLQGHVLLWFPVARQAPSPAKI